MNRFANKAEVMLALERGATIHSHDTYHWLTKVDGETARLRYSLWRRLFPSLKLVRQERRPPSPISFFIYQLKQPTKETAHEK